MKVSYYYNWDDNSAEPDLLHLCEDCALNDDYNCQHAGDEDTDPLTCDGCGRVDGDED